MENLDIIGVAESWINTDKRDFLAEYVLPGYTPFSCERSHRTGGGVLLYVKNNLNPTEINIQHINNIDACYVQIKNKDQKVIIGLIYRPPAQSSNIDEKLYDQIAEISCQGETIIFGDFNLPVARWGEPLNAHAGHDLYTNLQESALHQHVQLPTRGNNILDIILTTDESLVDNVIIGPEFSSSDHKTVYFDINIRKDQGNESTEKIPDYNRANFNKLRRLLANTDWTEMNEAPSINLAWDIFSNNLSKAVKTCVPLRNRRPLGKCKPKWWNDEIKNSLVAKKHAYDRYKATNDNNDKLAHDQLRRSTKKLIKQSKKNIELHIANTSKVNPKEFYSYIRNKKTLTSKIGPLVTENGEHTDDEVKMTNILNDFFASVFTSEDTTGNRPIPTNQANQLELENFIVYEADIQRKIEHLKINKTPGPDKISPRILKEAKNELLIPLASLFNKSVNTGRVPDEWKLANVTPIFKKGNKSSPGNYRPISLTSVVCKLLETIIRDKIVTFLEENNIIKNSQHGFRNKRSCLTNLLDFFNEVYNSYDEDRAVDIIYLDFRKAFDIVPHKRLIDKVNAHGITGNTKKWIENWLLDRKQRVVINGKESSWCKVNSGVPQGSVLGPILFIIYINDIDEGIECKISKFADDTKIMNKVTSTENYQKLQNDINTLVDWADKWQMEFNIEKCKVLHVGSNNVHKDYTMKNSVLSTTENEKDLGVTMSSDLKPSKQCTEVIKTANKLVGFIGRTFEFKSEKIILTLFNSLVRPHLEYCVQFWSPYYKKDINKLEKVQRRVTKMIPRLRNKSYEERLSELNLFSLAKRRLRGDLIEVFKIFKGYSNLNPNDFFTIDDTNYTRNNGYKIKGKRFRSHEAKHFFFNRVVNIWNGLPSNIVNCSTIDSFKNHVDKYLKSNPHLTPFLSE